MPIEMVDQHKPSLVSVIIPVYNRADTIVQAVSSALNQTYQPLEVVVIDDGSTDASAQIVRENFGDRVRLIQQANQGQSAAVASGMEHASGSLIAFLDSDDFWSKTKIERQVQALASRPNVCAVYSDAEEFTESGALHNSFIASHPSLRGESDLIEAIVDCHVPLRSTILLRRESLERLGVKPDPLCCGQDDIQMFLELLGAGATFMYLDEVTTYRRIHASNISGDHVHRFARRIGTYSRLLERRKRFPRRWRSRVRRGLSDAEFRVGEFHWGQRDLETARKHLLGAIRAKPPNWRAQAYFAATLLPLSLLTRLKKWIKG